MQDAQAEKLGKKSTLDIRGDGQFHPHSREPTAHGHPNDYAELKRIIRQAGLLDKQPIYYLYKILFLLSLLALSGIFLLFLHNPWLQLLNAAYWAFIFTQFGFIVHDACHHQILRTGWKNDILALVLGNLLIGLSRGWWTNKHNQHHGNPNQLSIDPDIDIPILAFCEEQALSKQGILPFITKYQAYFFLPLLLLEAFNLQFRSIQFLVQKKGKYRLTEALLLIAHYIVYFGLLFPLLGVWLALLFIVVHRALVGLYVGLSFASNHKGMLILDKDSEMDFLRRQVLTARNLKAHPVTDFVFGPLGCQIEHHLFPSIPVNKLREAQKIVKPFCQERSLPYYETSVPQAYREILQHLHRVGAPLRQEKERKQ